MVAPWSGDASYNLKGAEGGLDWERIVAEHDERLLAVPGGAERLELSKAEALRIQEEFRNKNRGVK